MITVSAFIVFLTSVAMPTHCHCHSEVLQTTQERQEGEELFQRARLLDKKCSFSRTETRTVFRMYKRAADKGHVEACGIVAQMILTEEIIDESANEFAETAAEGGDSFGMFVLLSLGANSRESTRSERGMMRRSLRELKTKALDGDFRAAHCIGTAYLFGDCCPQDVDQGLDFLHMASDQKYPPALYLIGLTMTLANHSVEVSETGLFMMIEAADRGYQRAKITLGRVADIEMVELLKIDKRKVLEWLTAAAMDEHAKAMVTLADYFKDGTLGNRDSLAATYWYRTALLSGQVDAGAKLGGMVSDRSLRSELIELSRNMGVMTTRRKLAIGKEVDLILFKEFGSEWTEALEKWETESSR